MKLLQSGRSASRHILKIAAFLVLPLWGCLKDKTAPYQTDTVILRWHEAYDGDTFEKALDGLNWGLSHIGATSRVSTVGQDASFFQLSLSPAEIGLTATGEQVLKHLHQVIIQSEPYQLNGWLDMGQYLTLIIGSSPHYYALTGVPQKLSDWEEQYEVIPVKGYVDNSEISIKPREIRFSEQIGFQQFFLSSEFDTITNQTLEFEVFDIMPNGQLRFGVFDADGNRINAANPLHSNAGKPGKCMWCHESAIQPLFGPQTERSGYLIPTDLADTLWYFRLAHKNEQTFLSGGVDFTDAPGHVNMELLYISYLEPSAEQLSREWDVKIETVLATLSTLETHEHEEFPFLGDRYWRDEVNTLSPYPLLPTPTNVREFFGEEVNLLE